MNWERPQFLIHFDLEQLLFVGLNRFKDWGFRIVIYHMKGDSKHDNYSHTDIELILFLSKCLNAAESQYWSTELKVACLIWIIYKICHFIENCAANNWAIIYINHTATTQIVKQTTLSFSSTDKLNLCLIQTS